jgi:hypothetical protein
LQANIDQFDVELAATHAWDFRPYSFELGLTVGGALLQQRFRTRGIAPPRSTAALQLSPTLAVTRDLSERSYLILSGSAATFLFNSEDSTTQRSSFGPSFALRTALGVGFRL